MQIKILVADDSASDRLIIKKLLGEYCLMTACDGLEAMRVLEEHDDINLLILDLNMPNANGFQVLEFLKRSERYKKLRTIILTNYDELDNEIRGLRLGAVDYIRKPIQMDSLRARIDIHVALIHAEQALEKRLDEQTLTFDMIFEQAPIGIVISQSCDPYSTDTTVKRVNSVYEQITGRTKDELLKTDWRAITHPDDVEEDINNLKRLQSGEIKRYSMEKRYIRPDGSIVWVYMTVAALAPMVDNTFNYICLIQDISERKQIEIERKYISEHDRWTGLRNRDCLEALLAKEIKRNTSQKRALISVNLSAVQLLTSIYGFIYTQGLIKKAAEALNSYATETHLLFQAHENRFVFYVTDYEDKKELLDFCAAITKSLEPIFITERIGGGIGILEIGASDADISVDLLLRRLLITSEKSMNLFGKDFEPCYYNDDLEASVNRELDIQNALTAIAADEPGDELFLQYQPILDLHTDRICAFEALARLNSTKLGLVSPLEFIPVAEKTKQIISTGEKVIVKALRFLRKLKEHGYGDIDISINISVIQLLKKDFTGRLFELINGMGINPENIGLEITESVFTSEYERINDIIKELRDKGLFIAIDDFGTGHSSLSREKGLNVDCMKIDKYFLDRLLSIDPKRAIIGDIISIAKKLGHYTIAEGVEYESQMKYLKEHNCDMIQGYLISKPLDEDEVIEFLKKHEISNAVIGSQHIR